MARRCAPMTQPMMHTEKRAPPTPATQPKASVVEYCARLVWCHIHKSGEIDLLPLPLVAIV